VCFVPAAGGDGVNAPGLVHDLPDDAYHANPALSASGAKKLLPPSCPAKFKWERENGQPPKAAFDLGKAAHAKVLGTGAEVVVVDADDWRTKAAQRQRDDAHAAGLTPILAKDAVAVDGMAAALRRHPLAAALLDPDTGRPEVSAFWRDDRHDIDRRCRFDFLPDTDGGRLLVPDYKSTQSAEREAFRRSAYNFGYHLQRVFYTDGIRALGIAEDIAFLFIAQETTAPYLVNVFELDVFFDDLGREQVDRACQVFAECTATDTWPGYSTDVELIGPPRWALTQGATA
jgi:hypothetical protein